MTTATNNGSVTTAGHIRLTISGHAIDRASQRLLSLWQIETADGLPGLHTWLAARAEEALASPARKTSRPGCNWTIRHRGIRFSFAVERHRWTLKTVMRQGECDAKQRRFGKGSTPRLCRVCTETPDGCICPGGPS